MTTTAQFLTTLRKRNVSFWADGDQLRYKAPKGALTPAILQEVRRRKAEILALCQQAMRQDAAALTIRPATEPFPLSPAQQRLWFLEELHGSSATYNIAGAFRLLGKLDVAALQKSIDTIVARHASLRTTFSSDPAQVVAPTLTLDLSVEPIGVADLPDLLRAEAARPFEIGDEPLIRARVWEISAESHILLLNFHHIVTDGQSLDLFNRELAICYAALSRHQKPNLPDLPIQYVDFAASQRDWMAAGKYDAQLAYWEKQLANAPDLLPLPLDHPRPAVQTFNGASHTVTLPDLDALRTLAQAENTSLFVIVQSALSAFLSRYCGTDDVLTGFSVANRTLPELEPLIGFFVNTLVLRADLSAQPTFEQIVRQVRGTVLDGLAQQEIPFEQIVEKLRPERDMSYAPLVQVMVSWLDGAGSTPKLGDVDVVPIETGFAPARFDLSLEVYESAENLQLLWLYNRDLFNADTIERLAENFLIFLRAAVTNPTASLHTLPMMSEVERTQLATWNETTVAYPETTLVALFEAQVERTPEANAVFGTLIRTNTDRHLSYRELDARSNQLARFLIERGVGRDVLVGVCMERSLEMVIALYGIIKAGGAYVPLDPTYPTERLAFMIEDAAPSLVLTQASLPIAGVCLDRDWEMIGAFSADSLPPIATPNDLAYMIYTSGSTGKPKGVPNTHRGIVNRLLWMQDEYQLTAKDRVLQKTPFSFDVSVWEFFWPLQVGAMLVVAQPEGHKDTQYLIETIERHAITTMHFVPSMLALFLEDEDVSRCVSLRRVICSGEALSAELQRRFFERLPCELHNLYGPTEAAVDVTYWQCDPHDERASVPIGRPVANTQIHIVDKHDQIVPIGVAGELLIGGAQVARGYHNRPELTAERFSVIGDKTEYRSRSGRVATMPNTVYRTGDLARWRADGTIDYLGRIDFQVKLRGFRIELGEIETVLLQHEAVREAVVVLRDERLVAYVVGEVAPQMVRAYLKPLLPDYMVPSDVVVLETMPLSPNGKIDRKQLPTPERTTSDAPIVYRSPLEEGIAAIWATVLQRDRIDPHANFFDLGGHSLLATQVVARIRPIYKTKLSVRALFEAPTIAALTDHVTAAMRDVQEVLPPITAAPIGTHYPLSAEQQRLWVLHQIEAQRAAYNIPLVLKLEGALDVGALERSVQQVVARHAALRTGFEVVRDRPMQTIHDHAPLDMPYFQHIEYLDLAQRIADETRRPFDLTAPPLIRAQLLQLDDATHALLLTIHHIIADGWSLNILLREVAQFYADDALTLPPLHLRYVDYAQWQTTALNDTALQPQLDYWREALAGLPPRIELPTDRPRPAVQSANGRIHYFDFDPALTRALKQTARDQDVTLFMLLLAGYATLLSRYSNQTDFAIGSGIANRTRPEVESLIGFFVNTLVLRMDTDGEPTFADLLARVRETTLGAYTHQDVPFERLVELLQPERDMRHSPFFQTIFTLQNLPPTAEIALPDVQVSALEIVETAAKLDITILMWEQDGGLVGTLEYNADLFDATTIERMVTHFETLLQSAVHNVDAPILALEMVGGAERAQLAAWNDTAASYPADATITSLFAEQVAATPDSVAIIFGETQLTYRELDERTDAVAAALQANGVNAGETVAIFLGRSHQMIVAILGVLKAGGIYVPVDPEYPTSRIAYMIEDCGTNLVLTDTAHIAQLDTPLLKLDIERYSVLSLRDRCANGRSLFGSNSPNTEYRIPSSPAYIIYTSGSTGQPKGCVVRHESVLALVKNEGLPYEFSADDIWIVAHSFCFDFSVWEMYGALLRGGRVIVAERETLRDPVALLNLLKRERVTVLNQTPAAFYNLMTAALADPEPTLHQHLRYVLFGGDHLELAYLREWAALYPLDQIQLVNMYGTTETTVVDTFFPVTDAAIEAARGRSLIGRPLPETQIHILNAAQQPQPIGIPGEIYVGGAGVSNGYLNKSDLTAQRFQTHPVTLYRTGDLGRWLPNGTLEHLGRNDFQVQLRGFRIELGEIEAVIARYPSVEKCVVLAREVGVDMQLVAYLIMSGAFVQEEIAAQIQAYLPAYMMPSAFVVLDELPLTHNGKIDRKALPAPDYVAEHELQYIAPRTETEQKLAELWQEILDVARVGIDDDFFTLGGHSLKATQVTARIPDLFGVDVPLSALFEAPTVAGLAEEIETLQWVMMGDDSGEAIGRL